MKTLTTQTIAVALAAGLVGIVAATPAAAACTPTGFFRDSINMTAAVIANGDITDQTIDAIGCNIGIYYGPGTSGAVERTEVYGANYFGLVVSGELDAFSNAGVATVDVIDSSIHDIGENPFNGSQHGVAVYYYASAPGAGAIGTISGNTIYRYQKGGIVANGPGAAAAISRNTVQGNGPVNYIAQNGIQIGFGGSGQIMRNSVTGHSYTGTNNASSAGILIFGGCSFNTVKGVQIVKNIVGSDVPTDGNDMGVALANYDPTCSGAPTTATNNKAVNNRITNYQLTNVSGNGYPTGYQAGIYESGVNDKLINNDIAGTGYANPCALIGQVFSCAIDVAGAKTKVHANSFTP